MKYIAVVDSLVFVCDKPFFACVFLVLKRLSLYLIRYYSWEIFCF